MAGVLATRLSSRITSLWHKRSAHPHSQRLDMLLHFLRQSPTTALACVCVLGVEMESCGHSSVVFWLDISLWPCTGDVMLHSLRTRSLLRNVTAGLLFVTHSVCVHVCMCVCACVCARSCSTAEGM